MAILRSRAEGWELGSCASLLCILLAYLYDDIRRPRVLPILDWLGGLVCREMRNNTKAVHTDTLD
jgi:hypothetical protein